MKLHDVVTSDVEDCDVSVEKCGSHSIQENSSPYYMKINHTLTN